MVNYSTMPFIGRVAVMATVLSAANAHLFLAEPKPLEGYSPKDPLLDDGSNWPCHGAPLSQFTSGGQKMTAGEAFPVKVEIGQNGVNTAVHGGGSAQLAITYEHDPVKAADPENWHVIYSVEGGYPANADGNVAQAVTCESDGQSECYHAMNVTMPEGVKSGNAILSWTWFNRLGNREMYQNCINVNIEGGTGEGMDKFPPMYVANIGPAGDGCVTEYGPQVAFPQPGEAVTSFSATDGKNFPVATPSCGGSGGSGGSPKQSGYGSGSPSSAPAYTSALAYTGVPSAPSAPAASSAPAAPSAGFQNSYTNQKGRQTATTFATMSAPAAPSAAPAPTGSSSDSASGASSGSYSSGSNSTGGSTGQCSEDGALVCNGPSKFGICDHGSVVWQDVSAGTQCLNGAIAAKSRFARRHAHFDAHKH